MKNTILVTGSSGFVGAHFCQGQEVIRFETDLLDRQATLNFCKEIRPTCVIHLAGQSFVPDSLDDPRRTYQINFWGTYNLLEALKLSEFKGRFLYIGSSHVYGSVKKLPILEESSLLPNTPYGASKMAAEGVCCQFSQTGPFEVIIARPFNQIGPGQSSRFAISSFAKQVVEYKKKKRSSLSLGNLDVKRDLTDVRDAVVAYRLLLEKGKNGEIYNVCSGREISLKEVLDALIVRAGLSEVPIEKSENISRRREIKNFYGSYEKLQSQTKWKPKIPLEQTLNDLYEEWEAKII
ncbi:MAG: GDP-mannose 4,6-dehydratase [Chlamydiia bacterium]|nr:GDP-mannose 4,6-dehydratase [Chlamydiia bacterium]